MNWLKRLFSKKSHINKKDAKQTPKTASEFASYFVSSLDTIDREYSDNPSGGPTVQRLMEETIRGSGDALRSMQGLQFLQKICLNVAPQSKKHARSLARIWGMSDWIESVINKAKPARPIVDLRPEILVSGTEQPQSTPKFKEGDNILVSTSAYSWYGIVVGSPHWKSGWTYQVRDASHPEWQLREVQEEYISY